jgi:hypothetical protein
MLVRLPTKVFPDVRQAVVVGIGVVVGQIVPDISVVLLSWIFFAI